MTTSGVQRTGRSAQLRPLVIDILVPTAVYYLLCKAFGLPVIWALAGSSIVPMIRSVRTFAREQRINTLAALMLAVNAAGILTSFVTGDPRLLIAKDSVGSGIVAICIMLSVAHRQPMMSAGMEPWLTRGDPTRIRSWVELSGGSPAFRRYENRFSLIWAAALMIECVTRTAGAFTLPISTMVWLSPVLTWTAIGIAIAAGTIVTVPMERMLSTRARSEAVGSSDDQGEARPIEVGRANRD